LARTDERQKAPNLDTERDLGVLQRALRRVTKVVKRLELGVLQRALRRVTKVVKRLEHCSYGEKLR